MSSILLFSNFKTQRFLNLVKLLISFPLNWLFFKSSLTNLIKSGILFKDRRPVVLRDRYSNDLNSSKNALSYSERTGMFRSSKIRLLKSNGLRV